MVNFYPNWVQPTEAPGWIAFDLSGHAFVGNPQEISQFTVDASTGALTGNGTTTTPNLSSYGAVDPSGRFLYTADIYYTVSQYTIDSAGTLTPNGTFALAPNLQANVLAFAQSGEGRGVLCVGSLLQPEGRRSRPLTSQSQ